MAEISISVKPKGREKVGGLVEVRKKRGSYHCFVQVEGVAIGRKERNKSKLAPKKKRGGRIERGPIFFLTRDRTGEGRERFLRGNL